MRSTRRRFRTLPAPQKQMEKQKEKSGIAAVTTDKENLDLENGASKKPKDSGGLIPNKVFEGEDEVARMLLFSPRPKAKRSRLAKKDADRAIGDVLNVGENKFVRTFLRIRPWTEDERMQVEGRADVQLQVSSDFFSIEDEKCVAVAPPTYQERLFHPKRPLQPDRFFFDHVFGPSCDQIGIYKRTVCKMAQQLHDNDSGLVFAFGVTNSGKTYTVEGVEENPGLLYHAMEDILKDPRTSSRVVCISAMEIYNEKAYDLMSADAAMGRGASASLKLQEDASGRLVARGLSEWTVSTLDDARRLFGRASAHRHAGETQLNVSSSRSHAIYTIKMAKRKEKDVSMTSIATVMEGQDGGEGECDGDCGEKEDQILEEVARLTIVDLAGSERASRSRSQGERFKEATNINTSLLTLGRCMEALRWNQLHPTLRPKIPPFRDSKITRMFQDGLSGASGVVMIVNVSSLPSDHDETLHVLRYASIAQDIQTYSRVDLAWKAKPKQTKMLPEDMEGVDGYVSIEELDELADAFDEREDELLDSVQTWRRKAIDAEKRMENMERDLRRQISDEVGQHVIEMEEEHQHMLRVEVERIERLHEQKMTLFSKNILRQSSGQKEKAIQAESMIDSLRKEHADRLENMKRVYEMEAEDMRKRMQEKSEKAHQMEVVEIINHRLEMEKAHMESVEDELRSQLEKKESKIATLKGRLEGLRKELDSQRMRARKYKTEMDHARSQLEASEKKREESEERRISETDCLSVEIRSLESQLMEKEDIIRQLRAENRDATVAMEKFEASLSQMREEKSDFQQKFMKMDAEKRTLQDRLDEMIAMRTESLLSARVDAGAMKPVISTPLQKKILRHMSPSAGESPILLASNGKLNLTPRHEKVVESAKKAQKHILEMSKEKKSSTKKKNPPKLKYDQYEVVDVVHSQDPEHQSEARVFKGDITKSISGSGVSVQFTDIDLLCGPSPKKFGRKRPGRGGDAATTVPTRVLSTIEAEDDDDDAVEHEHEHEHVETEDESIPIEPLKKKRKISSDGKEIAVSGKEKKALERLEKKEKKEREKEAKKKEKEAKKKEREAKKNFTKNPRKVRQEMDFFIEHDPFAFDLGDDDSEDLKRGEKKESSKTVTKGRGGGRKLLKTQNIPDSSPVKEEIGKGPQTPLARRLRSSSRTKK
eukprot:TRINITY_DN14491_c1_g1_i1.p1 TRINITY_DN14491_c1_g1~~TRINITY_DN14491_c1_g1_i1.p1  ORF type:complete len:1167 (+),score=444.86 TRINITY_DN14491_c1_g1_i1:100-3600(+)